MTFYKYSKDVMLKAVLIYKKGEHSFEQLSTLVGISQSTLKQWYMKYEVFGESVFDDAYPQRSYTKEQKIQAVEDFLSVSVK